MEYGVPVVVAVLSAFSVHPMRIKLIESVGTVAQKTAPMFAHFGKIGMVRSSDISKKYDIIT